MSEKRNSDKEVEIGTWYRSRLTLSFWTRTIFTLGIYYLTLWRWNSIKVTNRRITQRTGNLLGGEEVSLGIDDITDVTLNVPPMGAIFGYGDIVVQSAGSSGAEIAFKGLGRAKQLRNDLYDLQDGHLDE